MSLFQGLSAFPLTPANQDGHVNIKSLSNLLDKAVSGGVHSIGLLGSTGIYAYLNRAERHRAIKAANECIGGRVPLIVGISALRTDDTIILAKDAQASGADALLLSPMSYTPLTDDEVYQHFKTIAEATELPICIYNNPTTTRFAFSIDLIAKLSETKNIQAVKMPLPSGDDFEREIKELRSKTPEEFAIGYSGDWGCPAALLAGADTWYGATQGLFPKATLLLTKAALFRDVTEVTLLNQTFEAYWQLIKTYSTLRVSYVVANLLGLTDSQPPLPILPLSTDLQEEVKKAIQPILELEGK